MLPPPPVPTLQSQAIVFLALDPIVVRAKSTMSAKVQDLTSMVLIQVQPLDDWHIL